MTSSLHSETNIDLLEIQENYEDSGNAADNSVEAWRLYFEENRRRKEETKTYPKAPWFIFEKYKTSNLRNQDEENEPFKIEKISDVFFKARSLFWDEIKESLYFIDEIKNAIVRYKPALDELKIAKLEGIMLIIANCDDNPTFVIPIFGNDFEFLVGIGFHLWKMEWNGKNSKCSYFQLIQEQDRKGPKVNYGKADPIGRIVIGSNSRHVQTVDESQGYLKVYELQKRLTDSKEIEMENCTGIAWNWSASKIFIIIAAQDEIQIFNYNIREGKFGQKLPGIVWRDLEIDGSPACMVCDINDLLWIGCSNSGTIVHVDPENKTVLNSISLADCSDITSIAFAHSNRKVIYVTTMNLTTNMHPEDEEYAVTSGLSSLYRISNVGTRALAEFRVRLF